MRGWGNDDSIPVRMINAKGGREKENGPKWKLIFIGKNGTLDSVNMGEMYMKHTYCNETGILPTLLPWKAASSLLERNTAATLRQTASGKQGR